MTEMKNVFEREAPVNRALTSRQALDATGYPLISTDTAVIDSMPRGTGDKAKTVFFQLPDSAYDENGWISDEDLDKHYNAQNLEPEFPDSLAAHIEADPVFFEKYPTTTHWQDGNGDWCFLAFDRWRGIRISGVGHFKGFRVVWYFAGRHKNKS